MARSKTETFVVELPLVVNSSDETQLLCRFQAGRQLYNAVLSEAMVRMNLVRCSQAYKNAKNISRQHKKQRSDAFKSARQAYRYSDYDLQAYATLVSNKSKWIAQKLDSNTQQTLATRAFRASERILFGHAQKVRYKVPSRFRSVEGKTNKQGLRWKDNKLVWGKLILKPIIETNNQVIAHGLSHPVKYVRLLWRELNGVRRWYAQLVCEGKPYQKDKNYIADGVVGLDINVSSIAFVGDKKAGLLPFADGVPTFQKEIACLQRQMERSRRALNPDNYHLDFEGTRGRKTVIKKGQQKKGRKNWNNSCRYLKACAKKRELERRKSAYAKSQNRQVVNDLLRHGNQIKTEKVSIKGWQKRYGKAISAKCPGFVQSELKRKAENAGGEFIQFSTRSTALSQTHLNGERIKKSLSERVHYDRTGIVMHRDLFSAYLNRFVNQDQLSLLDAVTQYPGAEPLLVEAWKQYQQTANRLGASESSRSDSPTERFSQKLGNFSQIADSQQSGRKANLQSLPESPQFNCGEWLNFRIMPS